jgi:hypothetical protein
MRRLLAAALLLVATTAQAQDWNKPTLTDAYTSILQTIRDTRNQAAKMDYTGATNLPTGVIRWDATGKKFESWNGSAWSDIHPEVLAHLASTSNPHNVTAAQVGAATTSALTSHTSNTSNPHSVTAVQLGAMRTSQNLNDVANKATARTNLGVPATSDLTSHTGNTSNPHGVTAVQIGAARTNQNLNDLSNKDTARTNLSAAKSGVNSDITKLDNIGEIVAPSITGASLSLVSGTFGPIYLKPSNSSTGQWTLQSGGQWVPASARVKGSYAGFSGVTARRSINPSAATTQQTAEMVHTLACDMIHLGLIQGTSCPGY